MQTATSVTGMAGPSDGCGIAGTRRTLLTIRAVCVSGFGSKSPTDSTRAVAKDSRRMPHNLVSTNYYELHC
jgi:hypothetical protein